MKKTLLILLFSLLSLCVFAQKENEELYFSGIESTTGISLSASQEAQIKKLNSEIGPKFKAIGQDRSLSGYEKGQKKKALALKHKDEIRKILNEEQIKTWENIHGSMSKSDGLKNIMTDNYDSKLDQLEKRYEKEKQVIEDNNSLSKENKKTKLKALKETYKEEKEKIKEEKDRVKDTELLR